MRVVAALSGGVDSAVAAARAVAAGHDVTGVHFALSRDPQSGRVGARGCCTLDDARDARRVADVLGIPFYVWDLAADFERDVIADFVAEYEAGRTPNPCVRCNERIKFARVLDRALALGFDAVCTGHYARITSGPAGPELRRASDPAKDQSYVLAVLGPAALEHVLLPIGDTPKDQVRAEAAARGLFVAAKPDSHDICFIPNGDTAGWLRERLGERPGPVIDAATGQVLGRHDGTFGFTIGQRRGLALSQAPADGAPRYVLRIDPVNRQVAVGPKSALAVAEIAAGPAVWTGAQPPAGERCSVQVRAHGEPIAATLVETEPPLVRLDEPALGVAPGQSIVFYRGDLVLGGATIDQVRPGVPVGADG